nr:hypothetical protein 21 [bacterium]
MAVREPTDAMRLSNAANYVMTGKLRSFMEDYREGRREPAQADEVCRLVSQVCREWSIHQPEIHKIKQGAQA